MALMNEIQVGRYKQLLEQLLAMKGEIATQQLSPELLPVLVLGNDRPEWAALAGERLCVGGAQAAAVAAENVTIQLMNIPTSSVIITLEGIQVSPHQTGLHLYGNWDTLASGGAAASASYGNRDGRFARGAQATQGVVYTYHQVGSPITDVLGRLSWGSANALAPLWLPMPYVLTPGRGFAITCNTVNVALTCTFLWRERKLEPSER